MAGRAVPQPGQRPSRRRRLRTPLLILLAALIAATLMVALSARAVVTRSSCSQHPLVVTVAVAPDLAPAVRRVGRYYNSQHHDIGGRCARIAVTAQAPGTVAAELSGRSAPAGPGGSGSASPAPSATAGSASPGSASPASAGPSGASAGTGPASGSPGPGGAGTGAAGSQPPAAWIPDSSLWLDIARSTVAGAGQVQPTGINVASTPLMIAMPRQAAARLPAYGASVGWQFLLPQAAGGPSHALGLHVRIPDPSQSGTGLATLMAMRRLLGPGQQGRLGLAAFTFNAQVLPTTDSAVVLHSLAAPGQVSAGSPTRARSEPVTVTSEQSVVQYDRAHPQQPLAVRYPDPGTADLDYPYALTAAGDQQSLLAAAEQFGQLLTSSYATSYLRYEGFRSSDGTTASRPAAAGLTTRAPSQLPQPGPGQAASLLRAWAKLGLGARDLVLLDVSSAMAVPAGPGGPSLDSELKQAAANGLARFPDSTQMGLWAFASHLTGSLPYKQLVSIGPLPSSLGLVTRHQQIQQLTQGGTTVQAPAALYRAILAAYRQVLDSYQPRYVNAVVVMTAGVDSDPGDIPAGTLVRELRNLQDPQRPVEIVAIMVGRQGNLRALQQIAAVTGGQASAITSPGQIAKLFFSAISRRLCQPACPSG